MLLDTTTINSEDGLINEQIQAIGQDRFSRLWMAGPVGLSCYNGSHIKTYDSRNGLDCNGLRTLKLSAEDIVWIGTDRGLEAIDLSGKKVSLNFSFEWNFGIADSIFVDESHLWIGTSNGLIKLDQNEGKYNLAFHLDLGLVQDIIKYDDQSLLLVSGKKGLIKLTGNIIEEFCPKLATPGLVICVTKTIDQLFLVGTTEGLFVINDQGNIIEHFELSSNINKVTAIAAYGDEWWFGIGHQLVLVSPNSMGVRIKEVLQIDTIINDLCIDQLGNVWLGTNNKGLIKVTGLRDLIKPVDTQAKGSVFSIRKEPDSDQLLIGGDGFASLIRHSSSESGRTSRLIYHFPSIVWDTCFDPVEKSVTWYATQSGLYRSENNTQPVKFESADALIDGPNRAFVTRNDEIWLGTVSGLFCIRDNKASEILNQNGQKFGYVYTLNLDANNEIWIGTLGQGLWKETKDGICKIHNDQVSKLGNIYAIKTNEAGLTAVIQEERIILLDQQLNASLIIKEYPLAGWSIAWIDLQTIAVGSNNGLLFINVETCKLIRRINLHLSKADWQFTCSRSLFLNNKQQLFCGLNRGLFLIDLRQIKMFSQPPVLRLDEIKWQNVNPILKNNVYVIDSIKWSVNVSMYAAWFLDEKQIKYRFKLIGFDTNWPEFGRLPATKFNSLPPGQYELQGQAYTPFTGAGEIISLLRIDVPMFKWKNPISRLFNKLGILFDGVLGSSMRNKMLIERNLDLEREIEDRKKIEQELENYKDRLEDIVIHRTKDLELEKEKAEAADKMKTAFLANMSHEIRTPIGGVIGMIELLNRTKLDETQKEYVAKVDYSANHLLEIINDVLDISKIEAGKMEVDNSPFSINEVVQEIEAFYEMEKLAKNVNVKITLNTKTNSHLIGDPLKIKQVLLNLMSNAFKFTSKGEIRMEIEQVDSIFDKVALKFSVADTGIGMTDEQLVNVFQMFKQADSSISREYGGTGLGLSICYSFVEMMGGKLEVKSQLGKGSTFYFTLRFNRHQQAEYKPNGLSSREGSPQVIAPIDKSGVTAGKEPADFSKAIEGLRHAKILIAEDDKINQLYISRLMMTFNLDFELVGNGIECIAALKKNSDFDLILMDIQMPKMDGFATTTHIRKDLGNHDIKIIALTADVLSGTKEKVIKAGMNDYLTKPLIPKQLVEKLKLWIQPEKNGIQVNE